MSTECRSINRGQLGPHSTDAGQLRDHTEWIVAVKLFCWIFGHRYVPVSDAVGNDRTSWHTTMFCMRCAETKRVEL